MGFFNRRKDDLGRLPAADVADLPKVGDQVAASLSAHSAFIKRATCQRCGSPKTLPAATAYLYCDFCGSLVDYDFRIANANTNAGLTNTVFHRLIAPVRGQVDRALATGDAATYRQLHLDIFRQWVELCPQAVSPRAQGDEDFRRRLVAYFAECAVAKDLDPAQTAANEQLVTLTGALQRIPTPDGAWRVAGPFWDVADLFRRQMEDVYAGFVAGGVAAMDPDDPPPGVALRMEYSTFCQGWLPHLSTAEGAELLRRFGLTAEYTEVVPQPLEQHRCGGCGAHLGTVVGARVVVCESCGRRLDLVNGSVRCHNCAAPLELPEGISHLACPYCSTQNQRV